MSDTTMITMTAGPFPASLFTSDDYGLTTVAGACPAAFPADVWLLMSDLAAMAESVDIADLADGQVLATINIIDVADLAQMPHELADLINALETYEIAHRTVSYENDELDGQGRTYDPARGDVVWQYAVDRQGNTVLREAKFAAMTENGAPYEHIMEYFARARFPQHLLAS
jgi:hypothetical protein